MELLLQHTLSDLSKYAAVTKFNSKDDNKLLFLIADKIYLHKMHIIETRNILLHADNTTFLCLLNLLSYIYL